MKTAGSYGEKGKLMIRLFRGLLMSFIIIFNITHYNFPMGKHYGEALLSSFLVCLDMVSLLPSILINLSSVP